MNELVHTLVESFQITDESKPCNIKYRKISNNIKSRYKDINKHLTLKLDLGHSGLNKVDSDPTLLNSIGTVRSVHECTFNFLQ